MDFNSSTVKVQDLDMSQLLLQRSPFVFVDRLLETNEVHSVSEFIIREDNIFVEENGTLSENAVIENIAQTVAARVGYIVRYIINDSVKLGFIGSIRNFKPVGVAKVGDNLRTEIKIIEHVFRMELIDAEVKVDQRLIAKAYMKIALADAPAKHL